MMMKSYHIGQFLNTMSNTKGWFNQIYLADGGGGVRCLILVKQKANPSPLELPVSSKLHRTMDLNPLMKS